MLNLALSPSNQIRYNDYIQGDHDFHVEVDVLTLEEKPLYTLPLLDGQINLQGKATDGPERTASLILSDQESALDFGTPIAHDDEGVLWINRILRVRHIVSPPGLGQVTAIPFIGVPVAANKSNGELNLELGDKSVLADHGVLENTYSMGSTATTVITDIMSRYAGERRINIAPRFNAPTSKPYTVGMDAALSPWKVAREIAETDLASRLCYTPDGVLVLVPLKGSAGVIDVRQTLSTPATNSSFSDVVNYVRVTAQFQYVVQKKGFEDATYDRTLIGTAQLPDTHMFGAKALARNGAPRYFPVLIENGELQSDILVQTRAADELETGSSLTANQGFEIVPMFHLEAGDLLNLPDGIGQVPLDTASIPLGVGGNMTVGAIRWVSTPARVKATSTSSDVFNSGGEEIVEEVAPVEVDPGGSLPGLGPNKGKGKKKKKRRGGRGKGRGPREGARVLRGSAGKGTGRAKARAKRRGKKKR